MAPDPRVHAIEILRRRLDEGISLDRSFSAPEFQSLVTRDQGLVRELVDGVLRRRNELDFYIQKLSSRPLERLDSAVLWILRIGLYQIVHLRIPDYAAVNEAVQMCIRFGVRSAQPFVNAVLRRFQRRPPLLPTGTDPNSLSIRFSHPEWLVRRYLARWGSHLTLAWLRNNSHRPRSILWVNPWMTTVETFIAELAGEGIKCSLVDGLPQAVEVDSPAFSRHRLYQEGHCFFMDPSSQAVARALPLGNDALVADVCAAPGGKSFIICSRLDAGCRLVAADLDRRRLNEMRQRSQLCRIPGLDLVQCDFSRGVPFPARFDSVLVDVPCSGLGTLRSNPDIRWSVSEEDLERFQTRQIQIVSNAFRMLLPGGCLLYSTCSTEPEENEEVLEQLLSREKSARRMGSFERSFPGPGIGEGFFRALVRRV